MKLESHTQRSPIGRLCSGTLVLAALFAPFACTLSTHEPGDEEARSVEQAVTQEPEELNRAIFVRLFYDQSFYDFYSKGGNDPEAPDEIVEEYLDEVSHIYRNTDKLHSLRIFSLDDFIPVSRTDTDFFKADPDPDHHLVENRPPGEVGGNARLLDRMQDLLPATGTVHYRLNGTRYLVGRTVNVVFIYDSAGDLGGQVEGIGLLGTGRANLFVRTGVGGYANPQGEWLPLAPNTSSEAIRKNLIHEIGHMLGAEHFNGENCPNLQDTTGDTIMCPRGPRHKRFSNKNMVATNQVIDTVLGSCFDFASAGSCASFVTDRCSGIADQVAFVECLNLNTDFYCGNICNNTQRTVEDILDSL